LGGDVLCRGFDADDQPWRIGITSDRSTAKTAGVIINRDGQPLAAATSAVLKRQGKGWHHLIDPRTGQPAVSDVVMATAIARSGTAADIFAKSLVIDPAWLDTRPKQLLASYLQHSDGTRRLSQTDQLITEL
jgi:thiamine biosynthesis lipoprotein